MSPRNGDFFLIGQPGTERLEFKAIATGKVEWSLNGEKLATESSNSLFWPLRPGKWTLQVKSGDISDTVSFQVQLAERRETRRGFSIAKPPALQH